MKKTKIVLLLLFFPILLYSQNREIRGKVVDESGTPVPGVSIVLRGTSTGTSTDINGEFNLKGVPVGSFLDFSFIGMKNKNVEVTRNTTYLNVSLDTEVTELQETVVVGYGTQKKQSVVGAIGTAKADDIKVQGNVSNMTDALTGLIPGVSVLSISGMPGGDYDTGLKIYSPSEILVRGKTTWNNSSSMTESYMSTVGGTNKEAGNAKYSMLLTFKNEDKTVKVTQKSTTTVEVTGTGKFFSKSDPGSEGYNGKKHRTIYLDYTYKDGTNTYQVKDSLVFVDTDMKFEVFTVQVVNP